MTRKSLFRYRGGDELLRSEIPTSYYFLAYQAGAVHRHTRTFLRRLWLR